MGNLKVELVRCPEQADHVRLLAWEFVAWLKDRYPELELAIEEYLTNQDFRGMLDNLLEEFAPPASECLLAKLDGEPVGILMLKPFRDDICEMNRMFVRPAGRGQGMGRALCVRLIERARDLGYHTMVLSALDKHDEALSLYRSLGFEADQRAADADSAGNREVQMKLAL